VVILAVKPLMIAMITESFFGWELIFVCADNVFEYDVDREKMFPEM
jgi:hypothetical protein